MIETHTGCDYWVTGVGFVPGAFMSYAMDPQKRFGAPLYRTPRTWTHARLLNFGGLTSTIYPIRVPGGGQLFGRTPIEIFDPRERSPAFADGPVLARAGDRHRYESIGREEYDAIRAEVEAGTYAYRVEEGSFDCTGYVAWLAGSGEPAEKRDPESTAGLMLEVLDGGLRTTVQDMGRRGGQALGIPPSGAQDGFALRIANLLVGNPAGGPLLLREDPGAAGLEITLGRLRLRALQDHMLALAGADTGATVDGEPAPCWSSFVLRAGQTLACAIAR